MTIGPMLAIITPSGSGEGCAQSPVFMLVWLGTIAIFVIVPAVFYLLTVQKCLSRCSDEVRTLSPGLVWLMLIPLFNLIWHFIIVIHVAKSVRGELQKRGVASEPNPGQTIGLAMCILFVCGIIPLAGMAAAGAGFICWIIYWVQVAGLSKQLISK